MRMGAAPLLCCLFGTAIVWGIDAARAEEAKSETSATAPVEPTISVSERDHWAYRPLAKNEAPAVDDARWNQNPIDRFLKAEMQRRGVEPLPAVGAVTLLRRVSLDLTGLPPTPEQIDAFLADHSPQAYEGLVDHLLASPAYGERWAQHWLDLARFAETDGFEFDSVRPNAWRYRDWVIDALNRDLPFDEFVRLQIAGDELSTAPEAAVATGFLLCGPDMPDLNLQEERRHQVLNEMTATVGATILGLQIGCAQCHDHKYDPLTQYDFYRLRAFFEPLELFRDLPIPTAAEATARQTAEAAWTDEDHRAEKRRRELEELGRKRARDKNPDEPPNAEQIVAELNDAERGEHAEIVERLRSLPPLPVLPLGRVARQGEARPAHLYLRGDFRQPGPTVNPGYPQLFNVVLNSSIAKDSSASATSRADLARWLTSPENPLTARVIVNRVWQGHFGAGLTESASDFGVMGIEPSHPELLDWLARTLIEDGWSLKALHRRIVTSEAYQTASGPFDPEWTDEERRAADTIWQASTAHDSLNHSLWHRRRTRLDGETLRDCMLSAGERLSSRRGGPGVRPPLPAEVTISLLKDQWVESPDEEDHRRRSIYLFVRRNLRYPLFDVFDRPDTNASCPRRHESTTAPQSLVLLNSEFSRECAQHLAVSIARRDADPATWADRAYLRVFNRHATADEGRAASEFLGRQAALLETDTGVATQEGSGSTAGVTTTRMAALADLCLALFNANEFVYVD
ncbi:MAG TPA: DUF1549 and DUF1553 domain-containing protein [Pirellulales bacterium]|nr:DUF1549 and DUF1553 domain-containing protein [Pirellulales bacterium]